MCGRVACLRSISGSFISIKVGIKEGVSLQFHACNDGVISAQKYKICNSNCQTELEPDPPHQPGGNISLLLGSAAPSTQAVQH